MCLWLLLAGSRVSARWHRFSLLFLMLLSVPIAFSPAAAQALDIEDLLKLIRVEHVRNVEELVARLPQEIRENYTLVYRSESLQGASFTAPRAILFGRDARLVLTFNGNPNQANYNSIEVLRFNDGTESFEFYAIDFSDAGPRLTGPNPAVCSDCHGSPPHPIWSSYDYADATTGHWPGVYGSTHDAPSMTPGEVNLFERFNAAAVTHPRYRHLQLRHAGAPWFPYGKGPGEHRLRPNNRLGNLLARWRARQIAASILHEQASQGLPDVVTAWLLDCPGTDTEAFDRKVVQLFQARFESDTHAELRERVSDAPVSSRLQAMLKALATGGVFSDWGLANDVAAEYGEFNTGVTTVRRLTTGRWLSALADHDPLKRGFVPLPAKSAYDAFTDGYYERNVAPGGVGQSYDTVLRDFDRTAARQACRPRLLP